MRDKRTPKDVCGEAKHIRTHPEAMQRRMLTFIRNGIRRELSAKLSRLAQVTVHVYKPLTLKKNAA